MEVNAKTENVYVEKILYWMAKYAARRVNKFLAQIILLSFFITNDI